MATRKTAAVAAHRPPASKPAPRTAAKPAAPALAAADGPAKARPKLVRDGFTMPESDFALIATLKGRALSARREIKKSELLRAGLHALAAMNDKALLAVLGQLQPLKTGRPKKGH